MLDPRDTGPWQMVVCGDCGTEYQCTPSNDHYLRADDPEGSPRVCFGCLLWTPTEGVATESEPARNGRSTEPQPMCTCADDGTCYGLAYGPETCRIESRSGRSIGGSDAD